MSYRATADGAALTRCEREGAGRTTEVIKRNRRWRKSFVVGELQRNACFVILSVNYIATWPTVSSSVSAIDGQQIVFSPTFIKLRICKVTTTIVVGTAACFIMTEIYDTGKWQYAGKIF